MDSSKGAPLSEEQTVVAIMEDHDQNVIPHTEPDNGKSVNSSVEGSETESRLLTGGHSLQEKSESTVLCDAEQGMDDREVNNDDDGQGDKLFSMIEIRDAEVEGQAVCVSSDSDEDSSDSDSSSSSDETTSSEDSLNLEIRNKHVELIEEINALKNSEPPKVKGEILSSDLPPVADLNIVLPENTVLESVGKVSQIMEDNSIVIRSHPGRPALDLETVLFRSKEISIGKVEETFGPVPNPYYIVRFNNEEHLLSKGIEVNAEVFYAPHMKDFTSFVFLSALREIRGSDASWCNDTEPPPSCLDYSDDEEEREARRRHKKSREGGNSKEGCGENQKQGERRMQGVKRGHGSAHSHQSREHIQSQRMNVMATPDPALEGWHAAVNRMASHAPESRAPPSLLAYFQRPPMYERFPFQPNGSGFPIPPPGRFHHPQHLPSVAPPCGNNQFAGHSGRLPCPWPTRHPYHQPHGFGIRPPPPPPPT